MFLHVCVILFTGGGSASVHAGIPPPDQTSPPPTPPTPWEQTIFVAVRGDPTTAQECWILMQCRQRFGP